MFLSDLNSILFCLVYYYSLLFLLCLERFPLVGDKRSTSQRQEAVKSATRETRPGMLFQQLADASHGIARSGSCHAARESSGSSCRLVHVAPVAAHATGLDNPSRHRRDGEVADDGRVGRGHYCPFPL